MQKIHSKQITDLNVKHKSMELLEDNIEVNLQYLWLREECLDMTAKA